MLGEAQIWVNQKPSSFADMASRIGLPPAFVPYRQCAGLRCGTHIHNNNAEVIGQPLESYIWEWKPSPRFKIPRHKRAPAEVAAISPRQTGLPDLHLWRCFRASSFHREARSPYLYMERTGYY